MKTRLLFFLMTFSIANAQFNVSEGFESGTIPSGWTTDLIDGVVTHSSSCGGTKSARANYYTNAYAIIYTSSYVSNGQAINISYMARKQVGAFFGYQYLYYEVNGSGTWNQIANVYSDFSTCTPVNATIAAGVIPSGSTVKFRMQVNRASASNNNYVYFDNFTAVQQVPLVPQAIAEYSFDNTYNNLLGSAPFASNAGTSFTTDRHGNTSGAININSTGSTATITGLPYSNAPRTVSVWAKVNAHNSIFPFHNTIFSYGAFSNSNAFGCSITDGSTMVLGYNNNYTTLSINNLATWDHYVCAYDGTDAKVYKNGILLGSQAMVWNTINNSDVFRIGVGVGGEFWFNGAIDDLKIYNYVLNTTEISNLYTNNSLTSENFNANNLEVGLYPNPVNDILNIDTNEEILSVEVFALQGQKVMTSKQNKINVAELPAGIYLVRIEDVNNNIATKKIIKN